MREEENEEQITEKVKNVLICNLRFDEEEVQQEFNKFYSVGPIKDGRKIAIVRFKSHRFKEEPQNKKTTKNKKIKTKLSLTRTRTKTVNCCVHEVTNENQGIVNFAFDAPNGNLDFR